MKTLEITKILENLKGCTYNIIHTSAANYSRLPKLVPNERWSPAGKGLTSWLSFVVSAVSLSLSHWYPVSGVVLYCIVSIPDLCTLTYFHIVL